MVAFKYKGQFYEEEKTFGKVEKTKGMMMEEREAKKKTIGFILIFPLKLKQKVQKSLKKTIGF